jgi:acyl-CoA-binding protein
VLGEVEQLKLDSWKSCGGMSKLEAKKRYIELLGEVSPNWEEGVDVKGGNS